MVTKTITLGHPEGSHKNLEVNIKASSHAAFPQEFSITDQHGDLILEHKGVFQEFEQSFSYDDMQHLFLAVGLSHSDGKDHKGIITDQHGPWNCIFKCEDGVNRGYNDLVLNITAQPRGFR